LELKLPFLTSHGFFAQKFKRRHSTHLNKTQVTTWI